MPLAQVWTHRGLNWFFLSNPIFAICLNFQQQNPLKKQYFPHLSSETFEINSIKSDSPRALQQHKDSFQIPILFSVSILFNFHWENGSIINSFHTIGPKNLKPSQCTLTYQELSKDNKNTTWGSMVWEIWTWQNKTNYLASCINIGKVILGTRTPYLCPTRDKICNRGSSTPNKNNKD